MLKSVLRSLLEWLGLGYDLYRVYQIDLLEGGRIAAPNLPHGYSAGVISAELAREATDLTMREQAWYGGNGAYGFAIFFNEQPVCMQWYWYGERYRSMRGFWPLSAHEAKSVQLITCVEHRGRGLATVLKNFSARHLADAGYQRIFSRIWWNNHQSIRVSEKAGWRQVAIVALIHRTPSGRTFRFAYHFGGVGKVRRVDYGWQERPAT